MSYKDLNQNKVFKDKVKMVLDLISDKIKMVPIINILKRITLMFFHL